MRIDLHVHLAGLGDDPAQGCFVSATMRRTLVYHWLKSRLGGTDPGAAAMSESFARHLLRLAETSVELDYIALFAMDGVYDAQGELVPALSHLYVPNAYVFEVAARSKKLLPVISINPQRHDALAELEQWGPWAVALKWLGPLQKFDPQARSHDRFYDLLKELQLPLIAHSGCEHTFPGMAQRLGDPALYEGAVRRGIPVIFSHCGTGSFLAPRHDYSENFISLMERYDNVYGDTSAFCSLVRRKQLKRFTTERFLGRILHGSDWPIPSSALYFLPELGFNRLLHLESNRHPLDRDVATKRAMGVPDSVLTRAYGLLEGRIRHWEASRSRFQPDA